jgi:nicotinamide-nucleotide amidase
MHAEIISIGDEITGGQLLDTNTQWLSLRLEELGVRVLYHTTVGDDRDAMIDVFRQALERSDVVIATGGLGPTADDLTRDTIAEAAQRELEFRPEVLVAIREMFERRHREMPESNRVQAYFPKGSAMIPNPNGTAPGIDLTFPREGKLASRIFALPGVPAEMRDMWYGTVEKAVRQIGGGQSLVRHRNINCFGAGESQIESMLPDLIRRGREPRVGITASQATIILRITAEGATEEACDAAIEPTVATIHECLGDLVYGADDEQLEDAVVDWLRRTDKATFTSRHRDFSGWKSRTLSVVEWGTDGLVNEKLAACKSGDDQYLGGTVIHSRDALSGFLNRSYSDIDQIDVTTSEFTGALALASREKFGSDIALAVGPRPPLPEEGEDARHLHLAVASADGTQVQSHPYGGHPALLRVLSTKRALNFVRLELMK